MCDMESGNGWTWDHGSPVQQPVKPPGPTAPHRGPYYDYIGDCWYPDTNPIYHMDEDIDLCLKNATFSAIL